MEKDKGNMNARKRKTEERGCKLSFRLNAEEKERFDRMMAETEARDRTLLIKKSLFGETLRVVKTDKVTLDYYVRGQDAAGLLHEALRFPCAVPHGRQQLQPDGEGREKELRREARPCAALPP